MLSSHARMRVRQLHVASHLLAGLGLLYVALRSEQEGGLLPWVAGIAAVLLLALVGTEQKGATG
jgi:hypothetical protein